MSTPNVTLKDRNGVPIPYDGITQIEVVGHNSNGNSEIRTFTNMSQLRCYAIKANGDGTYKILDTVSTLGGGDVFIFMISDEDCRNMGVHRDDDTYSLMTVLSLNNLTKGESYTLNEILYTGGQNG